MISAVFTGICAVFASALSFLLGALWRSERRRHAEEMLEICAEGNSTLQGLSASQTKLVRALQDVNDALNADITRERQQVGTLAAQIVRLKSHDSNAWLRTDSWWGKCPKCQRVHSSDSHVIATSGTPSGNTPQHSVTHNAKAYARCEVCGSEWCQEASSLVVPTVNDWMKVCPACGWEHQDDVARIWAGKNGDVDRCRCLGCKMYWSKEDT